MSQPDPSKSILRRYWTWIAGTAVFISFIPEGLTRFGNDKLNEYAHIIWNRAFGQPPKAPSVPAPDDLERSYRCEVEREAERKVAAKKASAAKVDSEACATRVRGRYIFPPTEEQIRAECDTYYRIQIGLEAALKSVESRRCPRPTAAN